MTSNDSQHGHTLSRPRLYLLALASAVVTANAYYIHPIIAVVAEDFGVSASIIGAVPAFNQIALALGIFFLLPLGDRVSNKRLTSIFVAAQFFAIAGMAFAQDFELFVAGSTLLGFFTIAPYLLPAYVSRRVAPGELGHATAILTTGIIAGILVARAGGGILAEQFGWRSVYYAAAGLMLLVSILLPFIMEPRDRETVPGQSYAELILSIFPIIGRHPDILLSGVIQALSFGIFLAVWMGLGLHLTSPQMGYGVDVVGYLAVFSAISLVTTARLGKWADEVGATKARFVLAIGQLAAVVTLPFFGHSLWLLMIPIILMNLVGPAIDVSGRMTFLSLDPEIRTRLMTIYIVIMFAGGGIFSWAGTIAYDLAGWNGNAVLSVILSILVLGLAALSLRQQRER
ncbi:L-Proline/Glycine betaine transporter ProP [Candidatus Phaeomarinobacter ectocarpi]|uniref:L-Proline/Glycine betaine transporter ProP n=1 Tax=Candidatus Phaeomarinibacter ectocarpi TaxID=1458461 RepID=X5MM60_9HYPH|nr:MFS transporter [Candidatus Phaeomarinobacter ectocarpi]CDO60095.1 L-Proline/Glycine betaine transporter ProP [Candidatus Phaeomarinobacter ectocarpi]